MPDELAGGGEAVRLAEDVRGPGLSHVEISGGTGPTVKVLVGGHLLPCSSAVLTLDVQHVPRLVVSLPVTDGLVATLDAAAGLDETTCAALTAMGWKPPPSLKERVRKIATRDRTRG